jgi:hypothetical protein
MRLYQFLIHLVTLFIGCLIYIFFRSETILMFNWFEKLIMTETVSSIREITMTYQKDFPSWFLYSLPDGLWIFSYVCLIQSIWGSTDGAYKYFWIFKKLFFCGSKHRSYKDYLITMKSGCLDSKSFISAYFSISFSDMTSSCGQMFS